MPVTVQVHNKEPHTWRKSVTTKSSYILTSCLHDQCDVDIDPNGVSQSSFGACTARVTPTRHGLVDTAIEAWNNHHHLVLRPDDIWLAILCQLGFFITGHAEDLRSIFVAHKGQKELQVTQHDVTPFTADYAQFAKQMADQIGKNVKKPEMVDWALPSFSTTTDTDRVAGAVLLMGAMEKYFNYSFCCTMCGIPSVTLLGDKSDWELLWSKVEGISFIFAGGDAEVPAACAGEVKEFCALLKPLVRHMILSFDEPESETVKGFWKIIASKKEPPYRGSGRRTRYVTGWITAFCFWDEKGDRNLPDVQYVNREESCFIDGAQYVPLDDENAVAGYAKVPVKVKTLDAGGRVIDEKSCRMVAGSVATKPAKPEDLGADVTRIASVRTEQVDQPLPMISLGSSGLHSSDSWSPSWVFITRDKARAKDAPPIEDGLTAVQPQIGWMIFEEGSSQKS